MRGMRVRCEDEYEYKGVSEMCVVGGVCMRDWNKGL